MVVKRELDEVSTCMDWHGAENGNAVIIPAELIRENYRHSAIKRAELGRKSYL